MCSCPGVYIFIVCVQTICCSRETRWSSPGGPYSPITNLTDYILVGVPGSKHYTTLSIIVQKNKSKNKYIESTLISQLTTNHRLGKYELQ